VLRRRRHSCIGAPLARIEARRVSRRLFERDPHRKLVEQELEWRTRSFFRGLEVEV
jgi:cytochrome P450